jgi:DNA-binding MarR family transcriptional regulator
MKQSTVLFVSFVGAALAALPSGSALPLGLEPDGLLPYPIEIEAREDGSVAVEADTQAFSGLGEDAGIGFEGPATGKARMVGQAVAVPAPPGKAASAAIGTAVGIAVLAGLWNYFKYGALASVGGPLFSRIASHKILDNDVRNRVHECIISTPGVTIKEVTQLLGIGWGTAVYHLGRLEQERLIVSERHRQFRRYFKNGGGIVNDDKSAYAELKNPTTQRLAAEIATHPGTAQKDLCQSVGISAPLAHKHLARLEEAQLLTKQREWKTVKYFPTEKLVELLQPAPATPAPLLAVPA